MNTDLLVYILLGVGLCIILGLKSARFYFEVQAYNIAKKQLKHKAKELKHTTVILPK